jgi:hypothetical protein
MQPVPEAGALALWKRELARGERTMYTPDDLRLAAIHEANARDELRWGMINAANESRRAAAVLLVRRFAEMAA